MRKFLLFQRMEFPLRSQPIKSPGEIELTTPTPYHDAIPDGDYFAFLQRQVDEPDQPTMSHPDYYKYWRVKRQQLELLSEPATKYSTGRSDAEVVTGYMVSCYDHQFNMQLLYNLNQCFKAYHAGHIDMAIEYADLFQHYIHHAEQPLPNIHWQPVMLLQAMLLCRKDKTTQALALLSQFNQHNQRLDPDDLRLYHQLIGMIESDNFNQLDELTEELIGLSNHTQSQLKAYADLNLEAAVKLNAFTPQKRQIMRLCNTIASNRQHPNDIVVKPLELERQFIQITKQNYYLGSLLTALYQYELFNYYSNSQKNGEPDKECNQTCQLHLKQALDSLSLAMDAATHCQTATHNGMTFCHSDRNDFYFTKKQLDKLKRCCLFKVEGDLPTIIQKLEDLHQQQSNNAHRITTPIERRPMK
ncbi:MAG: hypothetical protein P1U34_08730 [Coxiellaceae bacterium]|nr:hypothetical protein [Coxiellaceae bacterium]